MGGGAKPRVRGRAGAEKDIWAALSHASGDARERMGKGWFRHYGLRVFIFKPSRLKENLEGYWGAALNHASGDARERMGKGSGFRDWVKPFRLDAAILKPSRLKENLEGCWGAALNHASGDARERVF